MNSARSDAIPYTSLSKRPQATTVTVRELLAKVRAGEIRIPSFQRPLRWRAADVEKLFDSIWRGYPIGSLLFWKREAAAEQISIGGASIVAPKVRDAWWVVDGQQRTTALAAALLDLDHGGDRRWSLWFDPDTLRFGTRSALPSDQCVPVSVLGDLRRLGRWIREHDLDDAHSEALEEAQQRILDYSIPVYVVDTDHEQALRAVFARLNSSGARMRADEVFQALLGGAGQRSSALDLDALQQACDFNGFGVPSRPDILKSVLAMSGLEPTSRPQNLRPDDLDSLVSFDAAQAALTKTTTFFQEKCGIPHVRLIPYPVAFLIVSRWFLVHPRAEYSTLARLAQWVWRGAVSGVHQRAEVSRMRRQVRIVDGDDAEATVGRLFDHVGAVEVGEWSLEPFDQRNARSRIETLALLDSEPRDLSGAISLAILSSGERLAREVVAAREPNVHSDLRRTVANRVLLDAMHTGLSRELRQWDAVADRDALASHLIDPAAFEALCAEDYDRFLELRGRAVAAYVAKFVERRTGGSGPIVRPHRYYSDNAEAS